MENLEKACSDLVDENNGNFVNSEPSVNGNLEADELFPNKVKKSSDATANGFYLMLADVIRDFDSRADDTLKSQDQLSTVLDRLSRELDQLLEDAPFPFIMQHGARVSGVRKRVSSLHSLLKSIQRRMDNINHILSEGMLNENSGGSSGQH